MLKRATWPLFTLSKKRKKIDTNPDYQRPAVWTKAQKQLLIDSILRDFDVPKIYLHEKGDDSYDVIDGQQRIRTIWSFYDDEFALAKDAEPVNGIDVANKRYSELAWMFQQSSIAIAWILSSLILRMKTKSAKCSSAFRMAQL